MSLTDRVTSILIGTGSLISGSSAPAVDEVFTPGEEGWDSLIVHYAHRVATLTGEQIAAAYPQGAQLGTRKFWITSAKPVRKGPGLWFAEVAFKGWASTKPYKISVGATAENQTAEPATIDSVLYNRVSIHQNNPTIRVSYLVENYTALATNQVGTSQSPPASIATPLEIWTSLADPVYHYPNGWVLMSREPDVIPGATPALVTDTYKWIRAWTP